MDHRSATVGASGFAEGRRDLVPPERLPYLRGVDGLRAIAVMAVLCYHADFAWARGGFLGVEVFFVISGFLITSLLLVEWLRTDRIDIKGFWLRRARRLLPAVGALLVVTSAASILVYRDTLDRMLGDVAAATGYVTNWFLIVKEVSYFDTFGRPPLLQHLWSLSVEEQFYVLWPIIFTLGFALFRTRNRRTTIRSFLAVTVVGILASTAMMAMLFEPYEDPSRVYYGTDTRASGILVGVALALVWIPWRLPTELPFAKRRNLNLVGWASLAVLVVILARMDEFSPFLYRGGFLLTSFVTAVLIATTIHPAGRLGAILEHPVLKWVGTRSYGIYLWHWPIFMITRPGVDVASTPFVTFVGRTTLTFLAAEASYRFIEYPIRRKGFKAWFHDVTRVLGFSTPREGFIVGAGALACVALLVAGLAWGTFFRDEPVTLASQATEDPSAAVELSVADRPGVDGEDPGPVQGPVVDTPAETTSTLGGAVDDPDPATTSTTAPPSADTVTTSTVVDAIEVPTPLPSVALIGDSVVAGAQGAVEEAIGDRIVVDATVNRQFKQADDVIADLREAGELGDVVIIHLGTNGAFSDATFDEAMEALAGVDRVIIVTTKVPRRWEASVNATIAEGAKRWPQVEIADWHAVATDHPEWFNDDQVHLNRTGMEHYAAFLRSIIG